MEMQRQVANEHASRAEVLREKMQALRFGLAAVLLVLLTTPMYAAFVAAKTGSGGLGWLGTMLAFFAVEIVVFVVLGHRAARVDARVTPWDARLAFALAVGLVPVAIQCAVSWRAEHRDLWMVGAIFVATAVLLHLGRTVAKLVSARPLDPHR